jgi:hypothetical protein
VGSRRVGVSDDVCGANRSAESLLRGGCGLQLRNGQFCARLAHEDARLKKMLREDRALIARRVDGYGGWLPITRLDDGSEMSLFLTRPPHRIRRSLGLLEGSSGFLIFIASQVIDDASGRATTIFVAAPKLSE